MNTETRTRMVKRAQGEPWAYTSPSYRLAGHRVYNRCIVLLRRGDIATVRRWRDTVESKRVPEPGGDWDRADDRRNLGDRLRALCDGYDAALMAVRAALLTTEGAA